jgi:hypothetical protein
VTDTVHFIHGVDGMPLLIRHISLAPDDAIAALRASEIWWQTFRGSESIQASLHSLYTRRSARVLYVM